MLTKKESDALKEKYVKEQAPILMKRIIGGTIYRSKIDINNMDEVIVAAYDMGRMDRIAEEIKEFNL